VRERAREVREEEEACKSTAPMYAKTQAIISSMWLRPSSERSIETPKKAKSSIDGDV
jgi:hypothetical protein